MLSRSLSLGAPRGSCAVLLHIMNTISHHRGQLETWQPPAGPPSQRERDLRVDRHSRTTVSPLSFDSSTSSGLWIALPWGLFILSESKPLTTTWNNKALSLEIKTTTWQEQVQLSFLLHSASKWAVYADSLIISFITDSDFVLWPLDLYV